MPIQVICPGCHARFKVSEKFAGQKGPCPKCKKPITIPKLEDEVVVHAPEEYGPKGIDGTATLKPIERKETGASMPWIAGAIATVLIVIVAAFAIGKMHPDDAVLKLLLGMGAFLLAPPLVFTGYTFLRDQELEPYSGKPLFLRGMICAVIYAALWGLHWYIRHMVVGPGGSFELYHLMYFIPLLVVPGALASMVAFDLDSVSASLHYGFYLLATVLLRLLIGLSPF